ncbi:hypothetical protein [Methanosarcina sp.]|nr:hypothetical protein [Methanosarcina sp.]HOW15868.1 hypothetical protein [Methanosarcina sp.]
MSEAKRTPCSRSGTRGAQLGEDSEILMETVVRGLLEGAAAEI